MSFCLQFLHLPSTVYDTRLTICHGLLQDLKWDGLAQGSLFQKPKANVVISLVSYEGAPLTIQNKARYATNDVSIYRTDLHVCDTTC